MHLPVRRGVINLLAKATTLYDNDDEMTDGVIDDIPSCHSCVTNERFEMKDKKRINKYSCKNRKTNDIEHIVSCLSIKTGGHVTNARCLKVFEIAGDSRIRTEMNFYES